MEAGALALLLRLMETRTRARGDSHASSTEGIHWLGCRCPASFARGQTVILALQSTQRQTTLPILNRKRAFRSLKLGPRPLDLQNLGLADFALTQWEPERLVGQELGDLDFVLVRFGGGDH